MKFKEYGVPCKWCGAKRGEPCKNQNGSPYDGSFHQVRRDAYKSAVENKYWDDQWK